jgi:hypothetical protein
LHDILERGGQMLAERRRGCEAGAQVLLGGERNPRKILDRADAANIDSGVAKTPPVESRARIEVTELPAQALLLKATIAAAGAVSTPLKVAAIPCENASGFLYRIFSVPSSAAAAGRPLHSSIATRSASIKQAVDRFFIQANLSRETRFCFHFLTRPIPCSTSSR